MKIVQGKLKIPDDRQHCSLIALLNQQIDGMNPFHFVWQQNINYKLNFISGLLLDNPMIWE